MVGFHRPPRVRAEAEIPFACHHGQQEFNSPVTGPVVASRFSPPLIRFLKRESTTREHSPSRNRVSPTTTTTDERRPNRRRMDDDKRPRNELAHRQSGRCARSGAKSPVRRQTTPIAAETASSRPHLRRRAGYKRNNAPPESRRLVKNAIIVQQPSDDCRWSILLRRSALAAAAATTTITPTLPLTINNGSVHLFRKNVPSSH